MGFDDLRHILTRLLFNSFLLTGHVWNNNGHEKGYDNKDDQHFDQREGILPPTLQHPCFHVMTSFCPCAKLQALNSQHRQHHDQVHGHHQQADENKENRLDKVDFLGHVFLQIPT